MSNHHGAKNFLIGAIAGSILAAGAALLFAPKPGAKLRKDITSKCAGLKKKHWL